ncbi:peptidase M56 family protein [Microbacterium sp. NPDC016588]
MNAPSLSPAFSSALRAHLVAEARAPRRRHRRGAMWTAGATVAVLLGGTSAAVASGVLSLPGAPQDTALGVERSVEGAGVGTLDLGPAPAGATDVALSLQCQDAGTFDLPGTGSVVCTTPGDSAASWTVALDAVDPARLEVVADAGVRWVLTGQYVSRETLPLGTNADGETFGSIVGGETPDLVAVVATNGSEGYVRRTDLEDADGTTAARSFRSPADALAWQEERGATSITIPVYASDGRTVLGVFVVRGGAR